MVWAVSLLTTDLSTRSLTPKHQVTGIRSLTRFGNLIRPLAQSVLYLLYSNLRLALKLFRGEPAISEFDWHFTPTHSSSPSFSTLVCSSLHEVLPPLHSGHG